VLQPGAFAVFGGRETSIVLDDSGDTVRLLAPEGTVVDAITFGPLAPNASYSRGEDGTWHTDWPPSPGRPNLPYLPPGPELTEPGLTGLRFRVWISQGRPVYSPGPIRSFEELSGSRRAPCGDPARREGRRRALASSFA
jgi:hypothetical protein